MGGNKLVYFYPWRSLQILLSDPKLFSEFSACPVECLPRGIFFSIPLGPALWNVYPIECFFLFNWGVAYSIGVKPIQLGCALREIIAVYSRSESVSNNSFFKQRFFHAHVSRPTNTPNKNALIESNKKCQHRKEYQPARNHMGPILGHMGSDIVSKQGNNGQAKCTGHKGNGDG